MPLHPGSRIGPYEILAPLGAGGMGEVYRARDARLGRDVAIKALPAAFARDPERLARFEREARLLASLNHPNIGAIYGLEEWSDRPHLVLELVEGVTLAARLARGPLPAPEALALGAQIAAAIEAAHERGIVHRDLKPGNVMLGGSGVAKVLDFGLAVEAPTGAPPDLSQSPTRALTPDATVAGAVLGTAAYMSPEQARGRAVDRRSDVWSFGCVLFECLAGRAPFAGDTVPDLIAKILEREPDWSALPESTPPRARELLRRCLRKDAETRPRDMRDVRLELVEIAAGGGRGSDTGETSIAVLPFENQSGADDEYFADGVTDEILNALAQVAGLRVAARSSCFVFKGRREDPRRIAEQLDVTTLLEGTVRRAGSRLRITAQLVSAADGKQLWSERYERELTDVFALQDEIAAAITGKLRGGMAPPAETEPQRRGTRSVEAYELFLKGRAQQYRRGGSIPRAIECFERAIALDPGYGEALAWLSDSYRLLGTYGLAPPAEAMRKARAAAERALAIDPRLTEALGTLADVALQYDYELDRARQMWERALAIDPRHVRARCERALWLRGCGEMATEEAIAEVRQAIADEPHNAWVAGMNVFLLGFVGRFDEALREAERSLTLDEESFIARLSVLQAYAWLGQDDRAVSAAAALLGSSGRHPWVLAILAWCYGRSGDTAKAAAVFEEMDARARHQFVAPFWLAVAAASAGSGAEAVRHLDRAFEMRDPILQIGSLLPHVSSLQALPGVAERFAALRGRRR